MRDEYEKVYGDTDKMCAREDNFTFDEECLIKDCNDVQNEIEQKEIRREELLKSMNHMNENLLYDKYRSVNVF